ncbi:MAG: YeeE/YedE family protein [Hyphomicrobiales bacterium]|nr:YeeE/YedE family protein [Hyphomicrobiales bacterium]
MLTEFTPLQSALGGVLIGFSAVLLMLFHGRIMGATGILMGVIWPANTRDWAWRAAVVAGMASGPALYLALTGGFPDIHSPVSTPLLLIGGFIVGIGVTFGSGCTSGHGVCGMARLSPRSIMATLTFMATTFATLYIVRHLIGG